MHSAFLQSPKKLQETSSRPARLAVDSRTLLSVVADRDSYASFVRWEKLERALKKLRRKISALP
jgi:hypothetical protein